MEPLLFIILKNSKKLPSNTFFHLADTEYQYWNSFQLDSIAYEFNHLNAFKHVYKRVKTDDEFECYITFSHHVFTTDRNKIIHTVDELYKEKKSDIRVFCKDRYQLSLMLPNIIIDLPNTYCYHGHYGKYCACEFEDSNGNLRYYQVVFKVFKSEKKLRLHIESAYPLDQHPGSKGRIKKVNFWYLLFNLSIGKKLPLPPR